MHATQAVLSPFVPPMNCISFCFAVLASSCGDPGPITNGNRFGSNFMVGNAVVYSCSTGYNLIGEPGLTCQADGQWSNPVPLCRG